MSAIKFYIIAGATGRQGGAVVDALLADRASVRADQVYAISREASGVGASKLKARCPGINILAGNLSDPGSIFRQMDQQALSQTAVFLAQAHGPTELSDAKAFIDAAATLGIPYFVYSSVDRGGRELSDNDPSYCKTFSDKFYIEQHLKRVCATDRQAAAQMEYTIIRPTWFADNALWGFPGQLCMTGWRESLNGKRMQLTVIKDIGRWAAEALLRPDETGIRNEALSIASDELSFDDVDRMFKKHTGKGVPVTYGLLTRLLIWLVKDMNTMFGFIGERPYGADIQWLQARLKPTSFETWLRDQRTL